MTNALLVHEMTRSDDFWRNTALQHCCDTVSNDYNIVPTLQHCVVLTIVVANRPVKQHLKLNWGRTRNKSSKWPERDSNPGPPDYESDELTTQPRCLLNKQDYLFKIL